MTTNEMMEVMKAYEDSKEIEYTQDCMDEWLSIDKPRWNWVLCTYRIKPSFEWNFPCTSYRTDSYGVVECALVQDYITLGLIRPTRRQAEDSHTRMVQSNKLEQLIYQFQDEVTNDNTCYIYVNDDKSYHWGDAMLNLVGLTQMNNITAQKICNLLNSGEVVL